MRVCSLRWRLGLLTAASYVFYSWWQFASWSEVLDSFRVRHFEELEYSLCVLAIHDRDAPEQHRGLLGRFLARADAPGAVGVPEAAPGPVALGGSLGLLGFFKYFGFFERIASDLLSFAGAGPLPIISMALPVGISFYTFESMSYVIDIYRGVAKPARSTCMMPASSPSSPTWWPGRSSGTRTSSISSATPTGSGAIPTGAT